MTHYRRTTTLLVIAVAGLLTANCTRTAPNLLICDRLQGKRTNGFPTTGYQSENKTDYKWQPVIKIDYSNKTILFAVTLDKGIHAVHPKIMDFTENSKVLGFGTESKTYTERYFLDLNQMKVSFSMSSSNDGYWSEENSQATCSPLEKMPEMIYQ